MVLYTFLHKSQEYAIFVIINTLLLCVAKCPLSY